MSSQPTPENSTPSATPPPPRRVAGARLARLCLKELRETLRDRRTIITLILMPLLVYPLLSIAFQRLLIGSLDSTREVRCIVGMSPDSSVDLVQRYLSLGETLLNQQPKADEPAGDESASAELKPRINWVARKDLETDVASATIDLAIIIKAMPPQSAELDRRAPLRCELLYRENSAVSKVALEYVQQRFQAVNDHALSLRLRREGIDFVSPVQDKPRSVGGSGAAFSLTTLIPLILILMTITGAVYPAIDLTAGERERGTLESLMAAPVPRLGLLAAKYVAVLTVALLTAGANLVAMTITLTVTGLGTVLFGDSGLSPLVVTQVFALLVLFAAFFSAVLLAVTSFARSFKEAQAYLIPLMLLSLAPGLISLVPGLLFDGLLAVTPLVNIVLLSRDLLEGAVDPALATVAVVSTLFYALAAIGLAARIFGTDAILYGSEASWSDLLRRPAQARGTASVAGAVFCLAILFPIYFVVAGILARLPGDSMQAKLVLNGLATLLLFGGLPLLLASFQRLRPRDAFQLHRARPAAYLAAVILGFALWPLAHEIFLLNEALGLQTLTAQQMDMVRQMLDRWKELPPWLIVAALAIAPAIGEELLFRGYLFRALLPVMSARKTIIITAVVFGGFHVLTSTLFAAERFLPTTFLGLILGWVCWNTRSVFPGMLLHACHNGLLLMVAYYQEALADRGWGVEEQSHMPAAWLGTAAVAIIIGLSLLWIAGRRK